MKKLIPDIILAVVVMIAVVAIIVRSTTYREDIAPINDADLRPVRAAAVAPEDNAFTYLSRATNAMCFPKDFYRIYYYGTNEDERWASNKVQFVQILASNETTFAEVDKALACSVCQLPEMTNYQIRSGLLAPMRDIFQLLCLKTDWLNRSGREADALELTMNTIKFGQVIESIGDGMIYFLIGSYFKSEASQRLEQMFDSRFIPSADLKRLARELSSCSCRIKDESLKNCFRASYAYQANMLDDVARGKINWTGIMGSTNTVHLPFQAYVLNVVKTKSTLADNTREAIRQIPMNYSQMRINKDARYEQFSFKSMIRPNGIGRYLVLEEEITYGRVLEQKCRDELNLEAISLLAALKGFKQDNSRLPKSLAELVPDYIDRIPADPFDGKPIRYSMDKKRIYSVGNDLIDSGGSEKMKNYSGDVLSMRRYGEDIVYRIEF